MASHSGRLTAVAEAEVQRILLGLPIELRTPAKEIPIIYDSRCFEELDTEGIGETLGLFVGANFVESAQGAEPLPAQIILFLENLWREADEDEATYRREVRATFLHELGHYLGLEEIDLEERGL